MSGQSNGLRAWLLQRFTAIYLALFLGFLIVWFSLFGPSSHSEWRDWMAQPVMNIASALFFLALVIHAWVGIRDVIMDYVHSTGLRVSMLGLVVLGLVACLLWSWRVLLLVAT